jgi:hypothetical protein
VYYKQHVKLSLLIQSIKSVRSDITIFYYLVPVVPHIVKVLKYQIDRFMHYTVQYCLATKEQ